MRLTEEEYNKYMEIHPKLIHYVGKKKGLIPTDMTFETFMNLPVEEKYPIRNAMYDNIDLLNNYIKEHTEILSEADKDIIRGFKYFERGTFYVIKLTKKFAYFLSEKYVYAVHALNDPFQSFWGNNLPTMVQTVLLPFQGKIIYDGIASTYPIHLGRGITASIKNDALLLESKYGIIKELPVFIDENTLKNNAGNQLLVMMKTKVSREQNYYEIQDLISDNPTLQPLYIKEWGRINSRAKKKALKALEIKKRWFAIHDDTIVASSQTEKDLIKQVNQILQNEEERKAIYYFKI